MTFRKELEDSINRNCMENASNTPDFILAQYLHSCLNAFDAAVQQRETWYGRDGRPSEIHAEGPNDRVEGRDACGASLSHAGLAGTED